MFRFPYHMFSHVIARKEVEECIKPFPIILRCASFAVVQIVGFEIGNPKIRLLMAGHSWLNAHTVGKNWDFPMMLFTCPLFKEVENLLDHYRSLLRCAPFFWLSDLRDFNLQEWLKIEADKWNSCLVHEKDRIQYRKDVLIQSRTRVWKSIMSIGHTNNNDWMLKLFDNGEKQRDLPTPKSIQIL